MRRGAALALALLSSGALSACGPYLFRQSDRLEIAAPASNSTVRQPLTIRWQAHDFAAPRDGRYAVFVDRDPMGPGGSITDYAATDRAGIYVVDGTSLRLRLLLPLAGVDPAEQNHHDVTVVMLDRSGARIGEYAAFTEFTVASGS